MSNYVFNSCLKPRYWRLWDFFYETRRICFKIKYTHCSAMDLLLFPFTYSIIQEKLDLDLSSLKTRNCYIAISVWYSILSILFWLMRYLGPCPTFMNLNKKFAELGVLILLRGSWWLLEQLLGTSWYFLTILNRFGKTKKFANMFKNFVTIWHVLSLLDDVLGLLDGVSADAWWLLDVFLMTSWWLKNSTKLSRKRQKGSKRLSRFPGTIDVT